MHAKIIQRQLIPESTRNLLKTDCKIVGGSHQERGMQTAKNATRTIR